MGSLKDKSKMQSNIYLVFTFLVLCIVEAERASHTAVDQCSRVL